VASAGGGDGGGGSAEARFRVLSRIAVGGMGEVFRATRVTADGFEKPVALKVVRPELAAHPGFAARFLDEARVAIALSHGNVVQSFDVGRLEDRWFLAMELVDGIDLASLLALRASAGSAGPGPRLPLPAVLLVALEALKGLDHAHRKRGPDGRLLGLVHRDVSPGNLLLSREGEVKLADFGIAVATLETELGAARSAIEGKVPYMAPEQLQGGPVDPRCDLYGLGAVLHELLTGAPPVAFGATAAEALAQVRRGPRREPPPDLPEGLWTLVRRALAPEPQDRYPSAAAMRQAVEAQAVAIRCLPSATDLAELVVDAVERERAVDGSVGGRVRSDVPRSRVGAGGRPGEAGAGGLTAASTAAAVELGLAARPGTVLTGTSAAPSAGDGGFDAILGGELAPPPQEGDGGTGAPTGWTGTAGVAAAAPAGGGPSPGKSAGPGSRRLALAASFLVAVLTALAGGRWVAERMTLSPEPAAIGAPRAASAEGTPSPPRTGPAERRTSASADETPGGEAGSPGGTGAGTAASRGAEDEARAPDPVSLGRAMPGQQPAPSRGAGAARRGTPRKDAPVVPPGEEARTESRRRGRRGPGAPTASAPPGRLSINTDPWSHVRLDGRRLGTTPILGQEVAPGRHRLTLWNPVHGVQKTVVVDVPSGGHERVILELGPAPEPR